MVDATPSFRLVVPRRGPERWLEHLGALTTLLTAVGYIIGYAAMSLVASGLGVSVRDLGLTLPDYLLLTATVYVALALVFVVTSSPMFFVPRLKERYRKVLSSPWVSRFSFALFLGAIVLSIWVTGPVWVLIPTYMLSMFTVSLDFALSRLPGNKPRVRLSVVWALALVVVPAALLLVSRSWPGEVRDYARHGGHPPPFWLTPTQALQPRVGEAVWAGGQACVVRVGSKVLLAQNGTLVVKELDAFRPTNCKVVDKFSTPAIPTTTIRTTTSTTRAVTTTTAKSATP